MLLCREICPKVHVLSLEAAKRLADERQPASVKSKAFARTGTEVSKLSEEQKQRILDDLREHWRLQKIHLDKHLLRRTTGYGK
jgi:hypothetical protein